MKNIKACYINNVKSLEINQKIEFKDYENMIEIKPIDNEIYMLTSTLIFSAPNNILDQIEDEIKNFKYFRVIPHTLLVCKSETLLKQHEFFITVLIFKTFKAYDKFLSQKIKEYELIDENEEIIC